MSNSSHLQDHPDRWAAATDEEHVQALFNPAQFVNPCWMSYLKRERPAALATYLRLFAADGGRLGPPARRFLHGGR